MKHLDNYYLSQEEPVKGCLIALKQLILSMDKEITNEWKYGMPFFCYKGKMFCYLWIHKVFKQPYFGIVEGKHIEHPGLLIERRSRMKIMLVDPNKDIPVRTVTKILKQALDLYKKGVIKTPR